MAGSMVLAGPWGSAISPETSHTPFVSDFSGVDVMTVIIASFVCIAVLASVAVSHWEGPLSRKGGQYSEIFF